MTRAAKESLEERVAPAEGRTKRSAVRAEPILDLRPPMARDVWLVMLFRRDEVTSKGGRVTGQIEVLASERPRWETLCARYWEKKRRKDRLVGLSTSKKKRAYRKAMKPGGAREEAARRVRELARHAGLPDVAPAV